MVTSKYERAVSAEGGNCRRTVIDLLLDAVMIGIDRNQTEACPWTFNPARKGPCELPA